MENIKKISKSLLFCFFLSTTLYAQHSKISRVEIYGMKNGIETFIPMSVNNVKEYSKLFRSTIYNNKKMFKICKLLGNYNGVKSNEIKKYNLRIIIEVFSKDSTMQNIFITDSKEIIVNNNEIDVNFDYFFKKYLSDYLPNGLGWISSINYISSHNFISANFSENSLSFINSDKSIYFNSDEYNDLSALKSLRFNISIDLNSKKIVSSRLSNLDLMALSFMNESIIDKLNNLIIQNVKIDKIYNPYKVVLDIFEVDIELFF